MRREILMCWQLNRCFFAFQMTSLKEKIEIDNVMRIIEKKHIRNTDMDLIVKFWMVNNSLFATNLGLCGFKPRVAYDILKMERVGNSTVLISYISRGKKLLYLLPERYANVVSDKDIDQINSGGKIYKIIRTIRKCDETRLWFDHKSYTWDLGIWPGC